MDPGGGVALERLFKLCPDPGARSEDDISLPDKPSSAVLPFVNLSKDPDQEYFVDV